MSRFKRQIAETLADQEDIAGLTIRSFTADDGRRMAELAGEAQANRRGHALRPGRRPVHTRGLAVEGQFKSNGRAGQGAPEHLAGEQTLDVWGRLSSCRADLDIDDRKPGPRGLAVRFNLADGRSTDLLAMSVDRFPVTSLDAFVTVSHVMRRPWYIRYLELPLLVGVHQFRGAWTFLSAFAPASYARCDFYAIHTFVWGRDPGQPVRYRWRAQAGAGRPMPWHSWGRRPDYLQRDMMERLGAGNEPVRFELQIQRPHDVPATRLRDIGRPLPRRVGWETVGTLELQRAIDDPDEATRRDGILFSPAHLIEGVAPLPGDEIMTARSAAYPASHVARSGYWP